MKIKNPQLGDIILIPFPFTDLSANKIRPALVLAILGDNLTVVFITSIAKKSDYSVEIKASKTNGLKEHSFAIVSKMATLDRNSVIGRIGQLEAMYMAVIKKSLRKYFKI